MDVRRQRAQGTETTAVRSLISAERRRTYRAAVEAWTSCTWPRRPLTDAEYVHICDRFADYLLAWYRDRLSRDKAVIIVRTVLHDVMALICVRPIWARRPHPGPDDILNGLFNAALEVANGKELLGALDHDWRPEPATTEQDTELTETLFGVSPREVHAALRELAGERAAVDRVIITQYLDLAELAGGITPKLSEVAEKLYNHKFLTDDKITPDRVSDALLRFRNRLNRVA